MAGNDRRSKELRSVRPITSETEIKRIRSILSGKPRDLLLFDLATQTGLKMKDILSIKVKDLIDLEIGDRLPLAETQVGPSHTATMSESIHRTLQRYIKEAGLAPDSYLFKSRKGQKPLKLSTVSNVIKNWLDTAGIKGPYGAKSLRKTWEYFAKDKSFMHRSLAGKAGSPGGLEPIERLPVQEQIYNKLLEGIATGRIPPGAKLVTAELSTMFKVSPTPVRMALSRLEARGFIISQKKKAYFVNQLSLKSLEEIISIRLALETLGVEISCNFHSEATIKSLESIIKIYDQADDFDDYQHANKQFHLTLCRDAEMPMLQQMISDLCDKVTPYFVLFSKNMDRVGFHRENISVHHRILEGFKRKDPQMACKWLKADLQQSQSTIKEMLEQTESDKQETSRETVPAV